LLQFTELISYLFVENLSAGNSEIQIYSYTAVDESFHSEPETEKIFVAEVNVQILDSYSLGDHIVRLFKKFRDSLRHPEGGDEEQATLLDQSSSTDVSRIPTPSTSLKLYPSKVVHDTVAAGARNVVESNELSPLMVHVPTRATYTSGQQQNQIQQLQLTAVSNSSLTTPPSSPPRYSEGDSSKNYSPRQLLLKRKTTIAESLVYDSANDTLLPLITRGAVQSRAGDRVAYFMPLESLDYALIYRVAGQLTYINGTGHVQRAERASTRMKGFRKVVISMRTVWNIDLVSANIILLHTSNFYL
jgi:hypothetical protein